VVIYEIGSLLWLVSFHINTCTVEVIKVKVKVPILIVELIPDSRQSTCRWQHALMNPVVDCHHLWPGPQWHTCIVINPVVGCHYFPPGPLLPSQPSGVTAFRPVPTCTAWWQRHIGVRKLPRVFMPWAQLRVEPTTYWSQVRYSTNSAMRLKLY